MAISLDGMPRVPTLVGSQACIRGMKVTVAMIDGEIASDKSTERLFFDFPYPDREDVQQAVGAAREADPPLREG